MEKTSDDSLRRGREQKIKNLGRVGTGHGVRREWTGTRATMMCMCIHPRRRLLQNQPPGAKTSRRHTHHEGRDQPRRPPLAWLASGSYGARVFSTVAAGELCVSPDRRVAAAGPGPRARAVSTTYVSCVAACPRRSRSRRDRLTGHSTKAPCRSQHRRSRSNEFLWPSGHVRHYPHGGAGGRASQRVPVSVLPGCGLGGIAQRFRRV